jgi:hypothetical protein
MQRTQHISHSLNAITNEATRGVQFGKYIQSWGDFPKLIMDIGADYFNDSYNASAFYIAQKLVRIELSYVPSDGVVLYYVFGWGAGSSGTGTGAKTIVPITSGEQPEFYVRYNSSDGTNRHAIDCYACKIMNYSFAVNYNVADKILIENVSAEVTGSTPFESSGYQGDTEPAFADGQTDQNEYAVDSNHSVKWDTAGNNYELADKMVTFQCRVDYVNNITPVLNQIYPPSNKTGDRSIVVSMQVKRDGTAASRQLWTDYLAQTPASGTKIVTGKTMTYKIYQSAAQYREYTFTNCILRITMNNAFINKQEIPVYDILILAASVTAYEDDGVNVIYYGQ